MMTEKELLDFITKNKEGKTLEYKLKPDFNEIQEHIEAIQKRLHFNILQTIYAFANTNGGELYIGIKDKEQTVEGLDNSDKERVEGILKKIGQEIKIEKKEFPLENGRFVIKITVDRLKQMNKPLFLDGILYVRENDKTVKATFFNKHFLLYKKEQLYMCYIEGIKSNLKQLRQQRDSFELNQFMEGLKFHIKSLIEKNNITGHEEKLRKIEELLDQIKKSIMDSENLSQSASPERPLDFDSLVREFIVIYKDIISKV